MVTNPPPACITVKKPVYVRVMNFARGEFVCRKCAETTLPGALRVEVKTLGEIAFLLHQTCCGCGKLNVL